MGEPVSRLLTDESDTVQVGAALGRALRGRSAFVTLAGDLGAGKTTLVRAALRALGHEGPVRSPTYSLIESYPTATGQVHHLDWYRLGDDEELEALGFRDLLAPGHSVLVEWPERIPWVAERADLAVSLAYAGEGRALALVPKTPVGQQIYEEWMNDIA
jgi:tRNA threonylcarbamoyladenosine biosynthesis protein TsaE